MDGCRKDKKQKRSFMQDNSVLITSRRQKTYFDRRADMLRAAESEIIASRGRQQTIVHPTGHHRGGRSESGERGRN